MRRLRAALPWVLLAAGLVAAGVIGAQRFRSGAPLDPGSAAPDGTKGVVELLRELGATVHVTAELPDAEVSSALLLSDDLDAARHAALLAWVRAGGVLVVADPRSAITRARPVGATAIGFVPAELERRCDEPALRDVDRVAAPGDSVLAVPDGARGCFPRRGGAWLVIQPEGSGTVVRLGGPAALVNAELGHADNALLVSSLLAPSPGARVTVLRPPPPGGGRRTLADLVAPRVKLAIVQLVLAFALLALWRARRLGRPVREPQPVQIPASELVVAVGALLQRARGRAQAAAVLADDLRRSLAERLGLPPSAPAEQVADAAAARTGIPRERILGSLQHASPRDEAELVALAAAIESVRREVSSVR